MKLFSRHKSDIEKYTNLALPTEKSIATCLKKDETIKLAMSLGIKTPKTWYFDKMDQLESIKEEANFPLVVKERNELYSRLPEYAFNFDQLRLIMHRWVNDISSIDYKFPLIQEYIEGYGCGFFALYQDGVCKRYFMHKRIRETPPSGGSSCCSMSIYDEDLKLQGKKILDKLNWHGVAMVEFKKELKSQDLYLIEINSKFWGSLDLALESGVNFPNLNVKVALGQNIDFKPDYKVGLKYHWLFDGEIDHLLAKGSSFFDVFKDTLNPKVKSNIWLSDPLPAFFSILVLLKIL